MTGTSEERLLGCQWPPQWTLVTTERVFFALCVHFSQAMVEQECVGAIVCKLDMHKKMFRRGYIAMLAVDSKHRRKSIGEISALLFRIFSLSLHRLLCCPGQPNLFMQMHRLDRLCTQSDE